jgi:hypothetical protein
VLAVALAYGIFVGSTLESTNTPSGLSSKVTCHSLHWDGIRHNELDLGNALNVSNAVCRRGARCLAIRPIHGQDRNDRPALTTGFFGGLFVILILTYFGGVLFSLLAWVAAIVCVAVLGCFAWKRFS